MRWRCPVDDANADEEAQALKVLRLHRSGSRHLNVSVLCFSLILVGAFVDWLRLTI